MTSTGQMNKDLRRAILQYSFDHGMEHIPSALSWCDFMLDLFTVVDPAKHKFVFGKFYGTQGVYVPLAVTRGYDISNLSYFISPKELPFVVEASHTIADSLGFAVGYALGTGNKVIVVVSDAVLQSGYMYEAIMYLRKFQPNILLLIDNNNMQVCTPTSNVIDVSPMLSLIESEMRCLRTDGHVDNRGVIKKALAYDVPAAIIFDTIKGKGVPEMENNDAWHYRRIKSQDELERLMPR